MLKMNTIIVLGNLVKDSELKYTQGGLAILTFTVAVQRTGKDKGSDFMPVTVFGTYAEKLSEFMTKGLKVLVKGRLKIDNTKDDKGNYKTYVNINAEEIKALGNKKGNNFNETPFEESEDGADWQEVQNCIFQIFKK